MSTESVDKYILQMQEFCIKYQNTLVLDCIGGVVRLIGISADNEDYYWVIETGKRHLVQSSAVGHLTPLKGVITDREYESLVRVWNLNHTPMAI